jgi:hypothetical protein
MEILLATMMLMMTLSLATILREESMLMIIKIYLNILFMFLLMPSDILQIDILLSLLLMLATIMKEAMIMPFYVNNYMLHLNTDNIYEMECLYLL